MKNKLMNFLISTIKLGITVTILLLGFLIWEEIEPLLNNYESEENYELIGSFNLDEIKEKENIKIPEVINSNIIDNIQSAASNNKENNNQNIDYSNVSIDKYFYNQLNDHSKTIYRAFESNKENMKNGRYQIDFGNTFSKILDLENGQDLLGKYYQSAIEAYTYDNPDVFYLSPNKMYLNIETTTKAFLKTYNVYINSGKQANYLIDEFNSKEQIDLAISKIEEIRNQITRNLTGNDYKDVKMIHDYLVDNVEYDTSISKPNIYNIYGTLVNKEVVCEGYARTFKYLLDYIKKQIER